MLINQCLVHPSSGKFPKYKDIQPYNVQSVRELWKHSLKCDVSIKSLPSRLMKLCGRDSRKTARARGDEGHKRSPCRHSRTDVHISSQRLHQCAQGHQRSVSDEVQVQGKEVVHKSPSLTIKTSLTYNHLQMKNSLLQLSHTGEERFLRAGPYSAIHVQHKKNSIIFLEVLCLLIFSQSI